MDKEKQPKPGYISFCGSFTQFTRPKWSPSYLFQPCPYGVDIPGAFRCYNVRYTDNFFTGMREYLMCTTFRAERTNASLCRQCGKCEQHCPQGIAVRKELKQVVRHMENPVYKVIAFFAKDMFKK